MLAFLLTPGILHARVRTRAELTFTILYIRRGKETGIGKEGGEMTSLVMHV